MKIRKVQSKWTKCAVWH